MFRRRVNSKQAVAACALCAVGVTASAQDQTLVAPDSPDATVERYLQLHGLEQLQATMLRERLANATGDERLQLAERLGDIYAEMLGENAPPERRMELERLSRELLEAVPGIDSFALRIKLAKAQYLLAERMGERWRMGLADKNETEEAQRMLSSVREAFRELGRSLNARVETIERQRRRGTQVDEAALTAQLSEALAQRSSAFYYAGWSGYYLALLTDRKDIAESAVQDLGWLLGAEGGPVSIEHLRAALLHFEHVARAGLAVGLCRSIAGDHGGALTWMRTLRESTDLHESVRSQLFSRQMDVLARAGRWRELFDHVAARNQHPMDVPDARLLAVLAMSMPSRGAPDDADGTAQKLAAQAISDLVTRGEVGHVLDLLRRFGTLPIGGEGFIVRYVRGLLAYEQARQAHHEAGEDDSLPTSQAGVSAKYGAAADLLRAAFASGDATRFPGERVRAGLSLGLAEFYRGRLLEAANRFEETASLATDPQRREEALWLAVVALDRLALDGNEEARQRCERIGVVYMTEFPATERAAVILLRRADADEVQVDRAIEVLFAVERTSPIYESARRHLGRLLYRAYRGASSERRDAEGARFLAVAEELLDMDETAVRRGDAKEATAAAQAVVVRVRQILDVVLSSEAPELPRAEQALARLDRVANETGMNLDDLRGELTYRRLQIAHAGGHAERVEELLNELTRLGGRFARSAERLLYRDALRAWERPGAAAEEARAVVRFGGRILGTPDDPGDRLSDDVLLGVADRVSEAAAFLWKSESDETMRGLALRLTRQWFERGRWTEGMLRRLAETAEGAGEPRLVFEAWNTLSAVYEPGESTWFEARYHAMRLLLDIDPQRGRQVVLQHETLYPSFGPEPWGDKIRALVARARLLPHVPAPEGARP
ncbi:MAG: hypothetical protein DYG94_02630 [Leptolyngbya sp. PLA3]|nr:MAG: hypothetical protein EDM82_01925 [Cyanobacteria bacterium CYA]MCE7967623.1 hypothetical protein [Leptolyngbya sp. PL-A3]